MNQKEKLAKVTKKGVRFSRIGAMSLGSKIAMGILALVVLMSVLSPFVSPYGPDQIFDKWSAPSGEHLFGTDHVGRDIFARVLYGGRFSLLIGLCSTLIALFFGAIIGSAPRSCARACPRRSCESSTSSWRCPASPWRPSRFSSSVAPCRRKATRLASSSSSCARSPSSTSRSWPRIVRANVMAAYGEDYVRAVIVSAPAPRGSWSSTSCATRQPRSWSSRPSLSPTRSFSRPP